MGMPPALDRCHRRALRGPVAALCAMLAAGALLAACSKGTGAPKHREAAPERDTACADPAKPRAYFYPAENRTDYAPDDPWKDGCALLVPDHLFCCPEKASAGSR
ncbi:hypothetical protein WME99_17475 [Sorangium sp. So ce136]|uniref:hypothetical protein n=1 Tax=Sorangium sp. So ce136 TaxID=3133284 RepID=UPI003EFCE0F4